MEFAKNLTIFAFIIFIAAPLAPLCASSPTTDDADDDADVEYVGFRPGARPPQQTPPQQTPPQQTMSKAIKVMKVCYNALDKKTLLEALPAGDAQLSNRDIELYFRKIGIDSEKVLKAAALVDTSVLPNANQIRNMAQVTCSCCETTRRDLLKQATCESAVCGPVCYCCYAVCAPCVSSCPCTCCCCIKEAVVGYTICRSCCYLRSYLNTPK